MQNYDIVWSSPSRDCIDSMPLSGRRGAGANVWVQDGSVWLYLAHNGAYDEQARLLKLGCLRITPVEHALGSGGDFRQHLRLEDGSISIADNGVRAEAWFAGEILYIELVSTTGELSCEVAFGTWRDVERQNLALDMGNRPHCLRPDQINATEAGLVSFHRNSDHSPAIAERARKQGIDPESVRDVITSRVFGAAIAMDASGDDWHAEPVRWQGWDGTAWKRLVRSRDRITLAVRLDAGTGLDPSDWLADARAALSADRLEAARQSERMHWREFWSRSYIQINPQASRNDPGYLVGQNYQLFRYMLACNRDGELPLLFNGGLFTVDNLPGRIRGNNNDELPIDAGGASTPDFRRWMYCGFMSQNQRWLGWPGVATGDADLVGPTIRFYRDRQTVASARAKLHQAEGVVYPEPMDALGLCCVWPLADGLCGAKHLTYHFSMMLEHAWMAVQLCEVQGTPLGRDLDWVVGTVLFYDSFYRRLNLERTGRELDDDGKLVLYPANGLEFAVGATNPVEVVAGLSRLVEGLLRQPDLARPQRARLEQITQTLPPLPIGERDGKQSLLPAQSYEAAYNRWEPIEHYAAWPYRMVGVTQPHTLQLARDTWDTIPEDRATLCKQDYSWMANVINMAACGWAEQAKERVIWKLANTAAPQARFPAFFGPGHDWMPDHNWGGSGMTGLQEMLLAPEPGPCGKLYLLQAWPVDWDVKFKLHAPGSTVVEAEVRGGKLIHIHVSPAPRKTDLVIPAHFLA